MIAEKNPTKNEFNPIIPALSPPPILLIDKAIPSNVDSLKSMSLELSISAVSGFF
jgi:hypothetical protein